MSNWKNDVRESIQKIAGTYNKEVVSITICTVQAVNEAARTCDCVPTTGEGTTLIPGVLLSAEANDGILLLPTVGSTVIVAFTSRMTAFLLMTSDVDKVIIQAANLVQFNDGTMGGLVQVAALTTKLNNIENMLNDLATKFNIHTHVVAAAPGTSAIPIPLETMTLVNTIRANIENTLVTHGI
jgi:hypothetical protein